MISFSNISGFEKQNKNKTQKRQVDEEDSRPKADSLIPTTSRCLELLTAIDYYQMLIILAFELPMVQRAVATLPSMKVNDATKILRGGSLIYCKQGQFTSRVSWFSGQDEEHGFLLLRLPDRASLINCRLIREPVIY